jgi:hypothetical protein
VSDHKYGKIHPVKTTIEIPDELFRKTKATAESRGETLHEFIAEVLTERVASTSPPPSDSSGWRSVFGLADPEEVKLVDAVIDAELEQVDPADWR